MSVRFKVGSTWRTVTQPWVKVGTVQKEAVKTWIKVGSTWKETWPLQPNPVGSPIATTVYRNDRIEIDVDWTAPTSAVDVVVGKYIIDVSIRTSTSGPISYSTTVSVNAPTIALTLTNVPSNSGYHTYAGMKLYVSVTAQSTAGVNSATVNASAVTVAQLPAPAMPTSYTLTINACQAHHVWANATGRTIDGVELQTLFNGAGPAPKKYVDTVHSADYETWNPASVGDGDVTGRVRTYGPGGVSAWRTVTGVMPGPVFTQYYRFTAGRMQVNVSGINPAVQVFTTDANGPWVDDGTRGPSTSTIVIAGSSAWSATDRKQRRMLLRPVNTANDWTGRDQVLDWLIKVANPYHMAPSGSNTWTRGVGWRQLAYEAQGASSTGQHRAYFFYSNHWYSNLSVAAVGYKLNVSSAQILINREPTGGRAVGIRPRLMLHRALTNTGDTSYGGAYDSTALSLNEAAWCAVPVDWAEQLMQGSNSYRGIGMFHANDNLVAAYGNVSAEYMLVMASGQGTIGGHDMFTVRVYHDG